MMLRARRFRALFADEATEIEVSFSGQVPSL